MLHGAYDVIISRIVQVSVHGQLSVDVSFHLVDAPDGDEFHVRVGNEAVPDQLAPGDRVVAHFVMRTVTHFTRS